MDQTWQEMFRHLKQLGEALDRLAEIARQKTAAVMRDDLNGVNECMKQEQVVSLSLRSMDIKRGKLLAALGLEQFPLRELPGHCPPELRAEARRLSESVRNKYMLYRSASDVARTTLEANLHVIENIIRNLSPQGARQQVGGGTDIRA